MKQPTLWILSMMCMASATYECPECQNDVQEGKAGVAMLVKANKHKFFGASNPETSATGSDREAVLVSKLLTTPVAELSESMVEELSSMVITPAVESVVKEMLTMNEKAINSLKEATDNDTNSREEMWNSFEKLENDVDIVNADCTRDFDEANVSRGSHITCRTVDEKGRYEAKEFCYGEERELEIEVQRALSKLKTSHTSCSGKLCPKPEGENVVKDLQEKINKCEVYETDATAYVAAVEVHAAKVAQCKSNKTAWETQRGICNTKQKEFEDKVCQLGSDRFGGCTKYSNEYNIKLGDYIELNKSIEDNVKGRRFMWKQLHRVNCSLGLLLGHTKEKHAELNVGIKACGSSIYDDSVLIIDPKAAPKPVDCGTQCLIPMPCEANFKQIEYGNLPDPEAPANTCDDTECTLSATPSSAPDDSTMSAERKALEKLQEEGKLLKKH